MILPANKCDKMESLKIFKLIPKQVEKKQKKRERQIADNEAISRPVD